MLQTQYASIIKRFIAFLIDHIIVAAGTTIVLVPVTWIFPPFGILEHGPAWLLLPFRFFHHHLFGNWSFNWGGLYMLAGWLYFTLFESSVWQATPGKRMLGIFVTDEQGVRISLARAVLRTVTKVFSGMLCFLGYIIALLTPRSQALHDLLASTLVLKPDLGASYRHYTFAGAPGTETGTTESPQQQEPPPGGNKHGEGTIPL